MTFDCLDGPLGTGDVESDLCWVYFEGKIYILFFKFIKDWSKAFGKIFKSFVPVSLIRWWESIDRMPDTRTGKPIDHRGEIILLTTPGFCINEVSASLGCLCQFLGSTLSSPFLDLLLPKHQQEESLCDARQSDHKLPDQQDDWKSQRK